jgi:hypothetical protein
METAKFLCHTTHASKIEIHREARGDFRGYFSLAVLYGTDTRMASDTK